MGDGWCISEFCERKRSETVVSMIMNSSRLGVLWDAITQGPARERIMRHVYKSFPLT